ncbi:hypothetical protein KEM54_005814 [Ascosphaera aggregata]|nr:hypothetical protein KEM54_005814 [Ascosphaera aggregata]
MHVAALTHDGKIYTWGQNDNAALGRDTTWEGGKVKDMDADDGSDSDDEPNLNPKEATPTVIPDGFLPEGTKVVQVAAGDCATFALTDTGLVYGWGIFRNENGSWGFYHTADKAAKKQAVHIAELKNIVQISAGDNFALALAQDGTVYSWGDGAQGQLGRQLQPRSSRLKEQAPSLDEASLTPHPLPFPKRKIVSIHAASNHAFAIDKTGGVWAWGLNNYSQTGISEHAGESEANIDVPRRVTSLKDYHLKMIDGGSQFSIGLTEDGRCLTWGRMDGSQIGVDFKNLALDDDKQVMKDERGKPRIMLKPANVDIRNCTWVAAGSDHSIAVAKDGKAYAWGFNEGYRCALGDDSIDDVVEPHRIENKLMKDKIIVWAGAGGQYSLVGIEPGAVPQTAAAPETEKPAEEEKKKGKQEEEEQKTEEKCQTNDNEEEKKDDNGAKGDKSGKKDEDEKMEDAPPATTDDADQKADTYADVEKDADETVAASS